MSLDPSHIENLRATNFRSDNMTRRQEFWRRAKSIVMAESCARQVWVGTAEEFEDFPLKDSSQVLSGKQAYAFLLSLASGLESPKRGETNIKGQVFDRWNKRQQRGVTVRGLNSIFQTLKGDSRIVGKILNSVQSAHHSIVSRDLSNLRKDSTVTMVSGLNAHERVPENFDRMLRVLNHRNRRPGLVYVTHPDAHVADTLLAKSLIMRQRQIIEFDVTSIPFQSLSKITEVSDHLFCDVPLGKNIEIDQELLSIWQNRVRQDNNFCHVSGTLDPNQEALGPWLTLDRASYISPLDVAEESQRRITSNKNLFVKAEEAVQEIATARASGKNMSESQLKKQAPHLLAA